MTVTITKQARIKALVLASKKTTAPAIATGLLAQTTYLLKVLNADSNTRTAVKNAAITHGPRMLVATLTIFESLSSDNKTKFIAALKRTTSDAVSIIRSLYPRFYSDAARGTSARPVVTDAVAANSDANRGTSARLLA